MKASPVAASRPTRPFAKAFGSVVLLTAVWSGASTAHAIEGKAHRLDRGAAQQIEESLDRYEIFEVPLRDLAQEIRTGSLELVLGERHFSLETEPVDIFTDDFRWVVETADGPVELDHGPVANFKGSLADSPGALVRLSSRDHSFGGMIRTSHETLYIDALSEFVSGMEPEFIVVYRDLDVRPNPAHACGTEARRSAVNNLAAQLDRAPTENLSVASQAGGLPVAEFSLEVDGKYYEDYGGQGTRERIVDFMVDVVGIYEQDLDLALRFGYGHLWTDAGTDPYTSQCAIETLEEFVLYWSENEPLYDVMHMFSGKTFDLGIIGVAFLEGVCCEGPECPPGAYGLSQDLAGRSDRKTLAAHEIGHNFNALHDDEFPTNCPGVECGSFGPIMCSFLQSFGSQRFSMCSQEDIGDWVAANNSCLD